MTRSFKTVPSAVAAAVAVFALSSSPAHALTSSQQSCVNALNKSGAKVAATQGKAISSCVGNTTKGKLVEPTTDACITADSKGKIAGAEQKTSDSRASKCSNPFPSFAYEEASTINDAATSEEIALAGDVFGSPVHAAIQLEDAGKCQAAVTKTYEKLAATRMKAFNSCKKAGLKDLSIDSAAQLAPCIEDDTKGKVAKAATKLDDTVIKKCEGITLATAFPGCSAEAGSNAALSACIERKTECRVCLTVEAMDGLDIGCDEADNGVLDQTCRQCGNGATEAPETCDDSGESATCDPDCTAAACGDSYTNTSAGEECDDGGVDTAGCDDDCTAPVCGDGNLNEAVGEVCDDGNLVNDDGCDANCTPTGCGNGITTTGEDCDDGGESETCDLDCTLAACGDGVVNGTAGETCDTSGESASCDADCTAVACGDGVLNVSAGEDCDDGNTVSGDGCSAACESGPGTGESHLQCPNRGELILYSKLSNTPCADNNDCVAPRTCDTTISRCTTATELDTGWNGAGHDADINDQVRAAARLACYGPPSPGCGECDVLGIDPTPGNCRCANNVLTQCDEPFQNDADDCGGAACNCFFGAPFPLSAQGTPVCVSNKFSEDITGTANPDLGSGSISANLRSQVFLGHTRDFPCPVCGGKCSDDDSGCVFDSDCNIGQTCVQDTPGDGIRDGLCVYDENNHNDNGVACDIDGSNASFPAIIGDTTPGDGGAGYSIDCQPEVGKNVSGAGLIIRLQQTTGTSNLSFGVDCDGSSPGTDLCPCLVCSGDQTFPCSSNAECAALTGACSSAPNIGCTQNADCTSVNIGPCNTGIGRCTLKTSELCTTNADCQNYNGGNCSPQTCTSRGSGVTPQPNYCSDDICTDMGSGEGECAAGPNFLFCDGLVKADGAGASACTQNADCSGGYGNCTISDPADCFLDPIVATGSADPTFPIAGATFCVPPTSNAGINSSAGLPGPGRVVNQGEATTYCTSNPAVEYTPGGAPACP